MAIQVLIVDDHAVLRAGLRMLLDAESDIEVIGEAQNGATAIQMVEDNPPDVVVLDISMPGLSGSDAIGLILKSCPTTKVLILTMHSDVIYVRQMFQRGAKGYVLKSAADTELITAIRKVQEGGVYIESSLAGEFVTDLLAMPTSGKGGAKKALSDRELEVLEHIAYGYSNRETAEKLHISVKTVETHRRRIMEKLEFATRAELVRYAIQNGILTRC
jgi:DNA-binding NarL/FixJ family response regulator